MRCILLSSVAYLDESYFSHYLINGTKGKILLNMKCVLWFYIRLLYETFLIRKRIQWDIIRNLRGFSCKVSVILVRFKVNLSFLDEFSKNSQISNFMKIRQVGAELIHADRRTDRDVTKLTVAFRNFTNAPNNAKPSMNMSVRTC